MECIKTSLSINTNEISVVDIKKKSVLYRSRETLFYKHFLLTRYTLSIIMWQKTNSCFCLPKLTIVVSNGQLLNEIVNIVIKYISTCVVVPIHNPGYIYRLLNTSNLSAYNQSSVWKFTFVLFYAFSMMRLPSYELFLYPTPLWSRVL